MTRSEILGLAARAVTVDRSATHGAPEDSFGRLAAVWSALTGLTISPAQAALMLGALKVVRAWGNPSHGDNWVDLAGYAACGGELATANPVKVGTVAGSPPLHFKGFSARDLRGFDAQTQAREDLADD